VKIFFFESCNDGTVGGSHSCMYNLIRNLDRSTIEVTTGFYSENIYTQRYRELGIQVEILPFPKPVRGRNVILRKAINWYNRHVKASQYLEYYFKRKGFDLLVLNNSIYASLLFARASNRLGIPVVVYERGMARYKKKHIKATADIQAVIPISNAVQQNLLAWEFKTNIIELIYDGVDPESLRPCRSPSEVKASLDIPLDGRVLGIVGNVRPWKGQKYFVEAFIELSRKYQNLYGLVVGGWGLDDQNFQTSLAETVRREGLRHRLRFLGYRTDVPDLLSILEIIVHASTKTEPFGIAILEAMAARKPVVATNLGGPLEILNDGECGILVPPKDGKAIADACSLYLSNGDFSRHQTEKAYRRVVQKFHLSQTVEKTVNLFYRVVNLQKGFALH
jgi:glycosyltransferase involved in cell wall biosynthesis